MSHGIDDINILKELEEHSAILKEEHSKTQRRIIGEKNEL